MSKYVPRLEGIMPSNLGGRALCLLTLGHISAYNMDNTILLYKHDEPVWTHLQYKDTNKCLADILFSYVFKRLPIDV